MLGGCKQGCETIVHGGWKEINQMAPYKDGVCLHQGHSGRHN